MKLNIKFWQLTTAILLIWLLFSQLRACVGVIDKNCQVTTRVQKHYQKRPKFFVVEKPVIVKEKIPAKQTVITYITDTVNRIDSVKCYEIALDYLTERTYIDTLQDDTAAIYYNATIRENRLEKITLGYFVKQPFITITNEICKKRNQWIINANLGTDLISFKAGASISLIDKRGIFYCAGVDFGTDNRNYYHAGVGWRISFRRQ